MVSSIVEAYSEAERIAVGTLSNRAIEAFGLVAFQTFGYPIRVSSDSELWRYHDVMQEGRFESNLRLLGAISNEEVEVLRWLGTTLCEFSTQHFERRMSGRHAATRALLQLRLVLNSLAGAQPERVLEMGPGSGYLSLLMAKSGMRVTTVEAAQALSCYQTLCFRHFFGAAFLDYRVTNSHLDCEPIALIRQLPWWKFANEEYDLPRVDVVAANSVLAELHPSALRYVFRRYGPEHKAKFGKTPVICAEALGSSIVNTWEDTLRRILRCGWTVEIRPHRSYVFRYEPEDADEQLARDSIRSHRNRLRNYLVSLARKSLRHKSSSTESQNLNHDVVRSVFDQLDSCLETPDERFQRRFSKDRT